MCVQYIYCIVYNMPDMCINNLYILTCVYKIYNQIYCTQHMIYHTCVLTMYCQIYCTPYIIYNTCEYTKAARKASWNKTVVEPVH